ncbi:hypothetical protein L596_012826 [Steinernema carpocapsae]|uniref:Uncharacterized protein n=1 Tax=Steinernema carpocapsae TaxID=34508 RepID=A0A4U5NZ80_STECR|nr:hypothetical protein L596_012826 [Steinernema carpocapsae]
MRLLAVFFLFACLYTAVIIIPVESLARDCVYTEMHSARLTISLKNVLTVVASAAATPNLLELSQSERSLETGLIKCCGHVATLLN